MDINDPRRRGQWQLVAFLIVLGIGLYFLDNSDQLQTIVGQVREPLLGVTQRLSGLNDRLQQPANLTAAREEITALESRVQSLERENEQLREIQAEYLRLVDLLALAQDTPNLTRVAADVIGRGSNPLFRDLIINKGSNDGIRVGMPVEASRGLVGQVFRTTPNAAQILLITDARSRIPVRLSQSRAVGILAGTSAGGLMSLNNINLEAPLAINEIVLTAGVDGQTSQEIVANRFPRDIVSGRVIEVERNDAELFQSAVVQPAVDFDTLETVFIVTDFTAIDATIFDDTEIDP